jgi:hypothetical protein
MAFQPSEYAPAGLLVNERPDRPDKSSEERARERRADRRRYSEVLQRFGWDDNDFSRAKRYSFPEPLGRIFHGPGSSETVYSDKMITQWVAELAAFAKGLR